MANKDQVAKLKQRNITLAGENAALRQSLARAFTEIEILNAKLRFVTPRWETVDLRQPEADSAQPTALTNHYDELLRGLS